MRLSGILGMRLSIILGMRLSGIPGMSQQYSRTETQQYSRTETQRYSRTETQRYSRNETGSLGTRLTAWLLLVLSCVQELRRQLSKLKQDKESLELNMTAVVDELQKDITGLQNKRSLDQDEIQRIKTSATELQQRVWTFQQENGSLRNQLGQQQVEMQRNIDSLQNELMAAKQQQVGTLRMSCKVGSKWS